MHQRSYAYNAECKVLSSQQATRILRMLRIRVEFGGERQLGASRSCILCLVSCDKILYLVSCAYCISRMLRNVENKSGIWGETAGSLEI